MPPPVPVVCSGLIPAHAGSTGNSCASRSGTSAHPRSRGEHSFDHLFSLTDDGSSPLTRGALHHAQHHRGLRRLIPAHAGSTPSAAHPPAAARAHPRSRGEHIAQQVDVIDQQGSSPLTRGAPFPLVPQPPPGGLIPAHAGSTYEASLAHAEKRAHPRSRGEHRHRHPRRGSVRGSSPLTRGALTGTGRRTSAWRLIPAHAGSTVQDPNHFQAIAAHPRSRGEHPGGAEHPADQAGSSPLTRGAQVWHDAAVGVLGLIPAHAAST